MMSNKFAIITGASSGIGLHLAKKLFATTDYSIVLACRSKNRAELSINQILQTDDVLNANFENVRPSLRYIHVVFAFYNMFNAGAGD